MTSPVEAAIRGVVTQGVIAISAYNKEHKKAKSPNPFLEGIHQPVSSEQTFTDLKVIGEIPAGLNGLYVRNGPNPLQKVNPATHHWFVGDAMLHGIRLEGGRALWYRNRWVRSNAVSDALGEPRAPGERNPRTDTANTNIVGHAGKLWAIVEAGGHPVEITADLETREHSTFGGTLGEAFSAHPHLDPETGEMHAICYNAMAPGNIWHVVLGTDGRIRRNEPIPVENGPMIHDCMITPNYVIVMDLPVTFSMSALIGGASFPYHWNPKHKARIGLLPREGKAADIIWCEVEPCYIFHPSNAYETEDGKVIMDACVYETMFASGMNGPDTQASRFESLVIDPAARRVTREVMDAAPQEFPRYDERRTGKGYRYTYAVALPPQHDASFVSDTRLFKHDMANRAREVRDFGPGRHPGEFVFVPKHERAGEDEGWLIGYVTDANTDSSEFVILDAQDFTGPAVATVHIPARIPPGFHGNFVPSA
ncbi:MAG TPA: carotenoid oxygenase family protein [Hyphomonas sp.]|nr:carotenoid oxygenase [Hyphomonas sp.]HRI99564.1 carotenoid oxygenase family protein [Hyphomonas sp.]HRK66480.1 carotenoid oxygenase family protein [Hyphomonas sp.]